MIYNGGLVLEGGGMRGMYTVGVMDYFMKKDVYFKDCFGVSAGANNGCSYLSKQPKRAFKIAMRYIDRRQYASLSALLITGNFFDKKFHTQVVPDQLIPYDYEAARQNEMNFYAVVTECETGRAVYKRINDVRKDIEWVWASGSLPLFAKLVELDGKHYMDGGIADSIPIKHSIEAGNKKNVVVLTRDITYTKKQESTVPLAIARYHKYPEFVKDLKERPQKYNETIQFIREEEQKGNIFVIRPKQPITIGRLEKNRDALKALYKQGYLDAKESYEAMLSYLLEE